MSWIPLVLGAYLLGSISFSYLLVRAICGDDVRTLGSGNAGATNVLRIAGKGSALVVLLLDVGKGAGGVVAAQALDAPGPVVGAAAVAGVVGHVFPAYHGLRGGKGVATAAGAFGGLAPQAAAVGLGVFVLAVVFTRYVAVGSMLACGLLPLFIWITAWLGWAPPAPGWLLVSSALVGLLIVLKHHDNLRRLRDGSEWKLGDPRGEEGAV